MTHARFPTHTASVAIAATLAALSTPVIAQQVAPPPVLAAPNATVPTPPVASAQESVAPPVLVAPTLTPSALSSAAPSVANGASDTPTASASGRTVTRTADNATRPAFARSRAVPEASAPVAPASATSSPTLTAPVIAPSSPVAPYTPTTDTIATAEAPPAETTLSDGENSWAPWAAGAGLAVVAMAGAALAMRRRRPSTDASGRSSGFDETVLADPADRVDIAPGKVGERTVMMADTSPTPPSVAPSMTAETASHDDNNRNSARFAPSGVGASDIEAMVAASPSPENPFLTRRNRIRRAVFLKNNGQLRAPVVASDRSATSTKPLDQADRSQSYSFATAKQRYGFTPQPA